MVLAACLGAVLSLLVYGGLQSRHDQLVANYFARDAERCADGIARELGEPLAPVRALQLFFAASQEVTDSEFRTFAGGWTPKCPHIDALGWAPRTRGPDDRVRFPVSMLVSRRHEATLRGMDLASKPECLPVLRRAAETGNVIATTCFSMENTEADGRVFGAVGTVGQAGRTPVAVGAEASPAGYVFGLFLIESMVSEAVQHAGVQHMSVYLFEEDSSNSPEPVARYPETASPNVPWGIAARDDGAQWRFGKSFTLGDRQWRVEAMADEEYRAIRESWLPAAALAVGLALTALLVGYLHLILGHSHRLERLVAERTRKLDSISRAAFDAVVMMDHRGNVAHWNPAAQRMFGYTADEIMDRSVHETIVPHRYRGRAAEGMQCFAHTGEGPVVGKVLEMEGLRKDGTEFPIELAVSAVRMSNQWWAVAIVRDITERRRIEESLRKDHELLKDMLSLHERQRQLIAYEIHDGLAQQLTGAIMRLQVYGQLRDVKPEEAHKNYEDGLGLLTDGLAETRRLISGLRPPVLDEQGVVAAIESLVEQSETREGPEIDFTHDVQFDRFASPLEVAVFRIVQESLTNAIRYSQSRKIQVRLLQKDDSLEVQVRDWGVGFDPEKVDASRFGLRGIRERARLFGGRAEIHSAPDEGTTIVAELPLVEKVSHNLQDNGQPNGDGL